MLLVAECIIMKLLISAMKHLTGQKNTLQSLTDSKIISQHFEALMADELINDYFLNYYSYICKNNQTKLRSGSIHQTFSSLNLDALA